MDPENGTENLMKEASSLLKDASRVLVITGAGISAESGVPTFRGEGERWRGARFDELATADAFQKDPQFVWEWYFYRRSIVALAKPNKAHHALTAWARSRPGVTLVTQNVDGLHESSGHPSVHRIHGSLWRNRCLECGTEREDRSLDYEGVQRSPCCGSLERPAIVWFDERYPQDTLAAALESALTAQVILTIGTSGVVGTTNTLILSGRATGRSRSRVIDVNIEDNDVCSHVQLRGLAATILPELLAA